VQGVGCRKRLYTLFYGSRVRLKIENVHSKVVISGEVAVDMFDVFQHKLESFAFVNKAKIKWLIKGDVNLRDIVWEIKIV